MTHSKWRIGGLVAIVLLILLAACSGGSSSSTSSTWDQMVWGQGTWQ